MRPSQAHLGQSFWNPATLLATWFGVGLIPKAPGTWGSLTALPCAWAIHWAAGPIGLAGATLGLFAIGVWATGVFAARRGTPDPPTAVIDEVVGQWLVLILVPRDQGFYILGFGLFRLADVVKPWPVSWADRRVKGGFGIMLDDVLAGVYAGLVPFALSFWIGR